MRYPWGQMVSFGLEMGPLFCIPVPSNTPRHLPDDCRPERLIQRVIRNRNLPSDHVCDPVCSQVFMTLSAVGFLGISQRPDSTTCVRSDSPATWPHGKGSSHQRAGRGTRPVFRRPADRVLSRRSLQYLLRRSGQPHGLRSHDGGVSGLFQICRQRPDDAPTRMGFSRPETR